jgi:hypothetical protein
VVVDYGHFSLFVIYKEGLCPSSEDINRLMMTINATSPTNIAYVTRTKAMIVVAEWATFLQPN